MRVLSKNAQTGHQGDCMLYQQILLRYMANGSKNPQKQTLNPLLGQESLAMG